MSAGRAMAWLAATVLIATIVHVASIYAIPRLVMMRVMAMVGAPNTMHLLPRPDAAFRMVVRPSTDLLYAQCPYDLAGGPLIVSAPVPRDTWWAVAIYDAASNNFFVRDDRQANGTLGVIVYPPQWSGPLAQGAVLSPTERGVVIIRTLVDRQSHLATLDALRRRSRCAPLR